VSDQLTQEELNTMSSDEIHAAYKEGRLTTLLGGKLNDADFYTQAWVENASPEQIAAATRAGHLDSLLKGTPEGGEPTG
jgi:hypothetical protein